MYFHLSVVAPKQGTYQYLILPGMDKENVAAFNFSDIRILRNDATVQAVYSEGNTTCWVAAYQPVQLTVSTDLILNIQTPGIYMIRKNESRQLKMCCSWMPVEGMEYWFS